ncbi:MAG: hypothetical protein QOJ03_1927 [Frankiaceae bacterium]|jgi:uncharacterized protein|nr:hypothetical protein [Frankiaceae bacterium]
MSTARHSARLDPRAPLVLDTRELGRRPGSMRRVQRTVPAPADWTLELVRVPTGSDVELDLRLESVMDGVLVSGTIRTEVAAECGRCLEPVRDAVVADVQELFAYDRAEAEDEALVLEGDLIDLEPVARDTVVLSLPLNPVCRDDCSGLCPGCGGRVAELDPGHAHDETDPRWASLSALTTDDSPASPEMGS